MGIKKMLIISSCSAKKRKIGGNKGYITTLTLSNPERRKYTEERFPELMYPARDLYLGRQHLLVVQGYELLKEISDLNVELFILSAGYGLVHSDTPLIPYDVTFSKLSKREQRVRGAFLKIPDRYMQLIKEYDFVIHLLGLDYLNSLNLPPSLPIKPLLIFVGGRSARRLLPKQQNICLFETNKEMCKTHHTTYMALKGKIFLEWAKSVLKDPRKLENLAEEGLLGIPSKQG